MIQVTAETVKDTTKQINTLLNSASVLLKQVRDGRYYEALGYTGFCEYVAGEIDLGQSSVYRLLKTCEMNELVDSRVREKLNQRQAEALNKIEPELRVMVAIAADRRADSQERPLTTRDIKTVGSVFETAIRSGGVDIGNGSITPIDAALNQEELEIALRQRQHIEDSRREWKTLHTTDAFTVNGRAWSFPADIQTGKRVRLIIQELIE